MKLYNDDGVEVNVEKEQVDLFFEAGWSVDPPKPKIKKEVVTKVEPEVIPEPEPEIFTPSEKIKKSRSKRKIPIKK